MSRTHVSYVTSSRALCYEPPKRLAAVIDELAKIMSGNRGDGERCAVTVAMPEEVVSPSSRRPSMDG